MSDSEEDYMSEAFLAKCAESGPGLVSGRVKRQITKDVRIKRLNVKNAIKPRHVLEEEKRSEGLSQVIGEGNKGFSLLQKMGYKTGMSLGKKGTGRVEPVPITFRTGRGGLGEETERKRRQQEVTSMRVVMIQKRQKREATFRSDYRAECSKMMHERQAESDLYKSQRVCEQLDEEQGLDQPAEMYFWSPAKMSLLLKQVEAELSDTEPDQTHVATSGRDRVVNNVTSGGDVDSDTEGIRTDYKSQQRLYEDDGLSDSSVEEEEDKILPPTSQQLRVLTAYLRSTYLYCVWCGTRYNDTEDLNQNCPGDTSEAHDS